MPPPATTRSAPMPRQQALRQAYALLQAGHAADALRVAAPLAADPADIDAALLAGLAAGAAGDAERAAPLLVRVGRARPAHAHPVRDLVTLLRDGAYDPAGRQGSAAGHRPGAEPVLRAVLAREPQDTRLHATLAEWLHEAARPQEALAAVAHWLRLAPDAVDAHILLGAVLAELGRMAEAAERFRHALRLAPDNATAWTNLGIALKTEGRLEEALAACREAVARRPADPRVRLNHAIALLHAGRFAQGWTEFEARLAMPGHTTLPAARLLPTLSTLPGGVAGRTILVTHEEGFGDTLQFVRYAPLLAGRGARVLLAVPHPLARLLGGLDGVTVISMEAQHQVAYDWHCPVLSLPRAFGTTLATIPAAIPYLHADPALVRAWAARLPRGPGLRVGLAWAGQARGWQTGFSAIDRRRSTTLASLAPLGRVPGVQLVSLQLGAIGPVPPGMSLHDPMPGVADFADTAAIIASLDLVVSVDTAVVHLAGALGCPVVLLDRYDACWRWLGRDESPWYPRLTAVRQERAGDWEAVVARVAALLESARKAGPCPDLPKA